LYSHAQCLARRRQLPSLPTRRSSDLTPAPAQDGGATSRSRSESTTAWVRSWAPSLASTRLMYTLVVPCEMPSAAAISVLDLPSRSEEHTSELQSRENLVCRLLLENKK